MCILCWRNIERFKYKSVTYFLNATSKASWMRLLFHNYNACVFVHISLNDKQSEATNEFSILHLSRDCERNLKFFNSNTNSVLDFIFFNNWINVSSFVVYVFSISSEEKIICRKIILMNARFHSIETIV